MIERVGNLRAGISAGESFRNEKKHNNAQVLSKTETFPATIKKTNDTSVNRRVKRSESKNMILNFFLKVSIYLCVSCRQYIDRHSLFMWKIT